MQAVSVATKTWRITIFQSMNKFIDRSGQDANTIFDNRSVEQDYRTLIPALRQGMSVLDIGCGTGAISRGIARMVGNSGKVIGIDHTSHFIESGKVTCREQKNLQLIHADLFEFQTPEKFDLVIAARVLQWLSDPAGALLQMKSFLRNGGQLSVLDYDHEALEWQPLPPDSMLTFYSKWLQWRSDAAMNNRIARDLPRYFSEAGLSAVETFSADEIYLKGNPNFRDKLGIWSKVARSEQIQKEGYISERERLQAIRDYDQWVDQDAEKMIMKLMEVRGRVD